jgi:molecular chaperone GrpE
MSENSKTETETDEKGSETTPEAPEIEVEQNETTTDETDDEAEVVFSAEEVEQLKAEYEAQHDRMLRTVAEYENSKKRAEREKEEFRKYALEEVVKDLIPVIDSIERAIESTSESEDFKSLSEGVQLIHKQFLDSMERRGVTPIEAVGEPFDPTQHDAIMYIESDAVAENGVIEDFQRGYMLNDRVIRPSMVSVSKGKAEKQEEPPTSDDGDDTAADSDVTEEKEETDNE